jgi:hypothetical protein
VKATLLGIVIAAVLALAATAGATTTPTTMKLVCHVAPGVTRITNITDDKSHFKFQYWYKNGTTWKSPAWAYYSAAISKGHLSVNTHGRPTRVLATMHRENGTLLRLRAACT